MSARLEGVGCRPSRSIWNAVVLGLQSAAEVTERERTTEGERDTALREKRSTGKPTRAKRNASRKKEIEEQIVRAILAEPGIGSGAVVERVQAVIPEAKMSRIHVLMTDICAMRKVVRREGKRGSYQHYPLDWEPTNACD